MLLATTNCKSGSINSYILCSTTAVVLNQILRYVYFIEVQGISQHVHNNTEICSLMPGNFAGLNVVLCVCLCFSHLDLHFEVSLGMKQCCSNSASEVLPY